MKIAPGLCVIVIVFGIATLAFITSLMTKKYIRKYLPKLHFNVRPKFQQDSVYKFFLVSNCAAWILAIIAIVTQFSILFVFFKHLILPLKRMIGPIQ